jgi:hypothetical protein
MSTRATCRAGNSITYASLPGRQKGISGGGRRVQGSGNKKYDGLGSGAAAVAGGGGRGVEEEESRVESLVALDCSRDEKKERARPALGPWNAGFAPRTDAPLVECACVPIHAETYLITECPSCV